MLNNGTAQTHERYLQGAAGAALLMSLKAGRITKAEFDKLRAIKLAYGSGESGTYGVTYYNRWGTADNKVPFVELSAFHQEGLPQLVTTALHELAHVLAGWEAAHGPEWRKAAEKLGLRKPRATGTQGGWCNVCSDVRFACVGLEPPADGSPVASLFGRGRAPEPGMPPIGKPRVPKPCGGGYGTKGGTSRGPGSGSRLRLWECACVPPMKVRASRELHATCGDCGSAFECKAAAG